MSRQGFSDRAGGRDWKQLLMDAGGTDLLNGTPFQEFAESGTLPSWLIRMDNVFSPDELQKFAVQSRGLLSVAQCYGTPNTEKTNDTYYRSINASRWPCTCQYWYPGWNRGKHQVDMYSVNEDMDVIKIRET